MRITILAPSAKHPVGGVTALYEFANALRHRAHTVCLAHVDFIGWPGSRMALDAAIDRVEEVTWFRFEEGIEHRVGVHDEWVPRPTSSTIRAPRSRTPPVSRFSSCRGIASCPWIWSDVGSPRPVPRSALPRG